MNVGKMVIFGECKLRKWSSWMQGKKLRSSTVTSHVHVTCGSAERLRPAVTFGQELVLPCTIEVGLQ